MRTLGLIPARAGSTGIARKNMALLAGRPMVEYTCAAALGSTRLDRIVVTTDDPDVAAVARAAGVEVPFARPPELAGDAVPMLPVIQHAVTWLAAEEGYEPDTVALLQPTSPLREARHVDEALGLLPADPDTDTVVSVVAVPHAYGPASLMRIDHGQLVPFLPAGQIGPLRRQDKPVAYARNGPAVLCSRVEVLASGSLYGDRVLPYVMGWPESIDVDSEHDLALAEFFLSRSRPPSDDR